MRHILRNDDKYTVTCEYVPHTEVFRTEVAEGVEVIAAFENERADLVIEFARRFLNRRVASGFYYQLTNDRDEVRIKPQSQTYKEACYRKVEALYGGRRAA